MAAPASNPRRCLLFVPGSRAERFAKALAADPDQVCIDLEDAVGPADKDSARAACMDFLNQRPPARSELGLRINPLNSSAGEADLAALRGSAARPDFVMLPKTESAAHIEALRAALGAECPPLIALIESPKGVALARGIAACAGLQALMFGGYDYVSLLRGKPGWDSFFLARAQLAMAAAEFELGFIDVPSLLLHDGQALRAETERVIALGATARAAIHPAQVETLQACFLPSAAEVQAARGICAALEAAGGGAIQVDGKLVDRPIALAAQRCLLLASYGLRDQDSPSASRNTGHGSGCQAGR